MKQKRTILIGIGIGIILLIIIIMLLLNKNEVTQDNNNTDDNNLLETITLEAVTYELDKELIMYDNSNIPTDDEDIMDADYDLDSLSNRKELEYGTNIRSYDTDGDGISDFDEIEITETDPLLWSSRNDGVSDMDYVIMKKHGDKLGWTGNIYTGGFGIYIEKAEDVLWELQVIEDDSFDSLDKISQIFKVGNFTGKMGFCYAGIDENKLSNIKIYMHDGKGLKEVQTFIDEEYSMLCFDVTSGAVFSAVYSE